MSGLRSVFTRSTPLFMKNRLFLCALFVCAIPVFVSAQTLPSGTWTGLVIPPSGENVEVTYTVETTNDTLSIVMHVPERGDMPLENIALSEDAITFNWTPGTHLDCTLKRKEDGQYAGRCIDASGEDGNMIMIPPEE